MGAPVEALACGLVHAGGADPSDMPLQVWRALPAASNYFQVAPQRPPDVSGHGIDVLMGIE
eukprot:914882-Pyramimonas_sp.AAC.2